VDVRSATFKASFVITEGKYSPVVFSESHGECVQIFVDLIEGCNRLDDVVVLLLHAELDLSARVGVAYIAC